MDDSNDNAHAEASTGNSNAANNAVVGHESQQQQQQQQEQQEVGHEQEVHITGQTKTDIVSGTTTARTDKGKEPDLGAPAAGNAAEPGGNDEFSCNICFDSATDPVLTICGHLFCWSCLVQWLDRSATCPVCKAGCDKDKRPPPPQRQPNQFFGFDPFGVPGSFHGAARGGNFVFTWRLWLLADADGLLANGMHGVASAGQPVGQQAFISRVFMMIAAMILVSILFY
ncbi:RING/U-box [Linderina pennispora]|uniref:RING-type E3 ubiquitin transferase n=1 Tax=Linderina pennispora TaxID=61395 RepID=A0A1Y1WGN2_9FUNG|nr:RING/U-box [Linderina pennispora]ORX72711.1 RING/U-box [Linderina pennispora]